MTINPAWNNIVVAEDLNAHNFAAHNVGETLEQLATLITRGHDLDRRKADHKVTVSDLHSIGGQLTYPVNLQREIGLPATLTDNAFNQLLAKLAPTVWQKNGHTPNLRLLQTAWSEEHPEQTGNTGTMPKRYLQRIPVELLDMILNYHFEHAPDRQWWLRRITPAKSGSGDVLRAIVGPRYPITYGNTALLETVQQLVTKHQTRFPAINLVRPELGDDTLHARVVYYERDTDDGPYGLGFYMGNDETGNGAYDVMMLIQRGRCTNSIVVDRANAVHIIHASSAAAIREQIFTAIGTALKLSDDLIDEFLATREVPVPDFDDVLDGLALKYGNLIDEAVKGIARQANATQGGHTKFGLINSLTFAAHEAQDMTAHNRAELEILSGGLIATPGSLFAKAAQAARDKRDGKDPNLNFAVVTRYGNEASEGE